MHALEIQNLCKSFRTGFWLKPVPVLNDVNFCIASSCVTGFIGANGAGKTTIFKSALGLIFPDRGKITFFDGQPLSTQVKKKIGFLPERPYFYDFLTGIEFLRFHFSLVSDSSKKISSKELNELIEKSLERVGILSAANKKLRNYSKGMLQRIGIAQAILHKPELLILDEPMSGLDPDGRIEVKNIIRELAAQGMTIFFSSHLLHDAEELCRNLVILKKGTVVYSGAINGLMKSYQASYEITYLDQGNSQILHVNNVDELQNQIAQLANNRTTILNIKENKIDLESVYSDISKGSIL